MEKSSPFGIANDPKTEFFMTASHQLKSPVAIVQWCLQSILEKAALDPDTRKLAQRALTQADVMSLLLGDMLRMFRMMHQEVGAEVETLTPVNIAILLDEIMAQYEPVMLKSNVRVTLGPVENVPTILADEPYLKQAVINLIDNAIKYSPEGGVVEVDVSSKNAEVLISVRDHGIGIPEAEQGRLFSEFFRGELAKEKTENGTGLGLVLVKHIAERFGGSVSFTSEVGKGSCFVIHLPCQATGK